MSAGETLIVDKYDTQKDCYSLVQQSRDADPKQIAKHWLYYVISKTLVDVENEGELPLSGEGYTKEDRWKMKNTQWELSTQ